MAVVSISLGYLHGCCGCWSCNRKCHRQKRERETGLVMALIRHVYLSSRLLQESADEGVYGCVYVWVRKGQNQRQLFIANDTDSRENKFSFS